MLLLEGFPMLDIVEKEFSVFSSSSMVPATQRGKEGKWTISSTSILYMPCIGRYMTYTQ